MELTTKQRAKLRSMANTMQPVLYIGKDGITDATIKEAYDALQARELIKCSVQQNASVSAREACAQLCEKLGASPVQTIGKKFVIYRRNEKKPVIDI
jgi:RNA-binding protein